MRETLSGKATDMRAQEAVRTCGVLAGKNGAADRRRPARRELILRIPEQASVEAGFEDV